MGTGTPDGNTKKINCTTCGEEYTTACAYQQGRCPHHAPLISNYQARFYNLLQFFKRKIKWH